VGPNRDAGPEQLVVEPGIGSEVGGSVRNLVAEPAASVVAGRRGRSAPDRRGVGQPRTATLSGVNKLSLDALARELLGQARSSDAGRSSETVYGGHEHVLRQTVIALAAGRELSEHGNPGESTLLVLRGRVHLPP